MKLFIKADNYTIKFALIMTAIADIAFIVSGIAENTMNMYLGVKFVAKRKLLIIQSNMPENIMMTSLI